MGRIHKQQKRVNRQVVLPILKSIEIAYKSIRARLLRSLITTITLILAVAFLSFTQVTIDIANGLLLSGDPKLMQALSAAGHDIGDGESQKQMGIENSAKQRWIVGLSLLVCIVGIVNAQLMAVTERFREIGTMKCLGALDHFIVRLFLLEALIQGLIGALTGALLGVLAAMGNSFFHYGQAVLAYLPIKAIGVSLVSAVITGSILSLIGVIYPVIVAARMQPVDAMRVDN